MASSRIFVQADIAAEFTRKLAERAMKAAAQPEQRLNTLARMTRSRALDARETAVLMKTAETFKAKFAADEEDAKAILDVGESKSDPTLSATELAQWTLVASQFLNLDEFLTK